MSILKSILPSISRLNDQMKIVRRTGNIISTIHISVEDIENIIGSLDINKAIGPDQVSHKLLKATKHSISESLCRIFNKSLDQETFLKVGSSLSLCPSSKKKKKKDKSCISNYRPTTVPYLY